MMWDERYNSDAYVYGKTANDFLREHYQRIPDANTGGKVLCLAEGEGRNAVFLARQGYQVTAVDSSSVGLKKANQLAAENNVNITTICADLADFDLGIQQWAGIVSIFCHLPATLRQDLYQRIEKALKPQGVFLLEAYRPQQLDYHTGGPQQADMMISKANLMQELPNLTFSHLLELERHVVEGIHHTGKGAVVQAIGHLS